MAHPLTGNAQYFHHMPILCKSTIRNNIQVYNYHYIDDILLSDSNADTLEIIFEKIVLSKWGLQIAPEKIQRGDSINYLGYKIGLHKIITQKVQIRKDRLQTLNDFQRLVGDISYLQCTIGIGPDDLINLNKTLDK